MELKWVGCQDQAALRPAMAGRAGLAVLARRRAADEPAPCHGRPPAGLNQEA